MIRVTRAPLSTIRLSGRRLLLHRAVHTAAGLFTLVALATYFVDWHEVRDSGFGEALSCAFMPDCHVTPRTTTEAEMLAQAPDAVHSGLDDHGLIPWLILLVILALRVAGLVRPRFWAGLAGAFLGLSGLAMAGFLMFDLGHIFEHTRWLVGQRIFDGAALGLGLAALFDLPLLPILFLGARRAQRRAEQVPGALPSARLRRPDARARRARPPSGCEGAVRAGTSSCAAGGTTRRR